MVQLELQYIAGLVQPHAGISVYPSVGLCSRTRFRHLPFACWSSTAFVISRPFSWLEATNFPKQQHKTKIPQLKILHLPALCLQVNLRRFDCSGLLRWFCSSFINVWKIPGTPPRRDREGSTWIWRDVCWFSLDGLVKVAAQDLVQCLEQKAADIPCPELPELWLKFSVAGEFSGFQC